MITWTGFRSGSRLFLTGCGQVMQSFCTGDISVIYNYSSKFDLAFKTLNECCFNVGPPSTTLDQHFPPSCLPSSIPFSFSSFILSFFLYCCLSHFPIHSSLFFYSFLTSFIPPSPPPPHPPLHSLIPLYFLPSFLSLSLHSSYLLSFICSSIYSFHLFLLYFLRFSSFFLRPILC